MCTPPPHNSGYDKVELVWPGKTTEVERVSLPFQTIERVNEVSRSAAGQARLRDGGELPDWWPEGWRNKLIWGDNKYVLSSLLDEFAGKVDLIYIDPPFATGADFSIEIRIGDFVLAKEPSVMEMNAYRDTWAGGTATYLTMMYERLALLHELLAPTGSMYVHCDPRLGPHLRLCLDELFGESHYLNTISWDYKKISNSVGRKFSRSHDSLLLYTGSAKDFTFNPQYGDVSPRKQQLIERGYNTKRQDGKYYLYVYDEAKVAALEADGRISLSDYDVVVTVDADRGTLLTDVLRINFLNSQSVEYKDVRYPTQKPKALLEPLLAASSRPGDLVLDAFAGSGTTLAVSEKLDRRWIGIDMGRYALHTMRKRLLKSPDCRPFEILNLGRYDRSRWQGTDVGERIGEYYDFIIQLYGATRLDGFNHLHGIKGDRMIHVGATDAPVTGKELELAISECAEGSTLALDVLGWEWEMGLNPSRKDELAHFYEVDVHLLNIPREVMDQKAVEAGDIHFFELSVVELEHAQDDRGLVVEITNFLPAVDHYMAEKVGDAISQWSDWIDYWSIDFDYNGETFINSWQSYRTRQDRSLSLTSDPHRYETPGKKTVVVKVIDIFGNDTTRELTVEVN